MCVCVCVYLPAAKWRGVLFLPATSLKLTLSRFIRALTFSWSPFLHASKRLDCSFVFGFAAAAITPGLFSTRCLMGRPSHNFFYTSWKLIFVGRIREPPLRTLMGVVNHRGTMELECQEKRCLLPVTALEFCHHHRSKLLLSGELP